MDVNTLRNLLAGRVSPNSRSWSVERYRNDYRATLDAYVPLDTLDVPSQGKILSLGCGFAYDALVQSGFVGRAPAGQDSDAIQYVGIDSNYDRIDFAKKLYPSGVRGVPKQNYTFINGDARNLDAITGDVAVVFASHPEVLHRTEVWSEIIDAAGKKLKPNGVLVSTLYFPREQQCMLQILGRKYRILQAAENTHTHQSVVMSAKDHQFIVVAQKR
jgi:SAM-dependent methyltransferase